MLLRCLLLVSILLTPRVTALGQDQANTTEMLEERLRTEAPKAWEAYRLYALGLQGTSTRTINDNQFQESYRTEIKHNASAFMDIRHVLRNDNTRIPLIKGLSTCAVYNAQHCFSLSRGPGNAAWEFLTFKKNTKEETIQEYKARYEPMLAPSLFLWNNQKTLADLVSEPSFRVRSITSITQGGEELVEIVFENRHRRQSPRYFPSCQGTLRLYPRSAWSLHSCEFKLLESDNDLAVSKVVEYHDLRSVFPLPRRMKLTINGIRFQSQEQANQPFREVEAYEFDLAIPQKLPGDEEFALAKFGLREPEELRPLPIVIPEEWHPGYKLPVYWWILICGGSAFIVVLVVARLVHQRKKAQALSWDQ